MAATSSPFLTPTQKERGGGGEYPFSDTRKMFLLDEMQRELTGQKYHHYWQWWGDKGVIFSVCHGSPPPPPGGGFGSCLEVPVMGALLRGGGGMACF